jgi:uncharacterized protein DUF4288
MGGRSHWFSVRLIVEIKVPRDTAKERTYDDRILVVRAASELAARRTAEELTRASDETYVNGEGKTIRWRFREILETSELLVDELTSGTEVYSTFIDFDRLQKLRRRSLAPWPAYRRAHPKADPRRVTVGEVVDWVDRPERKRYAFVVRAHAAYVRAHPANDASKMTVRDLLTWYAGTSAARRNQSRGPA